MQPDLTELCAAIRYQHRQRVYAMEQRKRADLALGSFLRMMLGWTLSIPKDEQARIREQASDLMRIGEKVFTQEAKPAEKRKPVEGSDDPLFLEWRNVIIASIKAREPFDDIEAAALKQMKLLVTELPVWTEYAEGVRGLGEASVAIIVAEAGDLSNYPKKGHLWKRMGVAVIDDRAQGKPGKGATAEEWIAEGYSPARRSRLWTIGDALIKQQGPYREIYLERKEVERQKAEAMGLIVAPSAKIPAKRAAEFMSDGHIHRRAQRYMEKRLLRDLWQAWNGRKASVGVPDEAEIDMPTVYLDAAE